MEATMSDKTLRYAILALGLVTGLIHAVLLNLLGFNLLMLLNGLGFLILTWAVFTEPNFLAGQRKLVHYLFIAYTLVTIVGFFVLNTPPYGPLGIIAKIDEVLLIVALWLHKDR
jgi:hypothetical protein